MDRLGRNSRIVIFKNLADLVARIRHDHDPIIPRLLRQPHLARLAIRIAHRQSARKTVVRHEGVIARHGIGRQINLRHPIRSRRRQTLVGNAIGQIDIGFRFRRFRPGDFRDNQVGFLDIRDYQSCVASGIAGGGRRDPDALIAMNGVIHRGRNHRRGRGLAGGNRERRGHRRQGRGACMQAHHQRLICRRVTRDREGGRGG